jgi:hypothetical protein
VRVWTTWSSAARRRSLRVKLLALDAAKELRDLRVPPGNELEALKGDGSAARAGLQRDPGLLDEPPSHFDLEKAQDEIAEEIERDARPRAA